MSVFRYYLSYPTSSITYSDEIEITERVVENGVTSISQNLSNNEYDVGSVKFNKIGLKVANNDSYFSEAENQFSIFTYKRDESILRIEWDPNPYGLSCGSTPCGYSYLSKPIDIYKGLLEDNSSKFDDKSQVQTFTFLGLESIIGKEQTPFSSLSASDDAETTIYNILNTPKITRLLTVDQANINVNVNFTPDSIAELEDTTSLESIDEILSLSGGALYVKDDTIYVSPRQIGATSKATFRSSASDKGLENIINIENITGGLNRTFNHWSWKDTTVSQQFADSISTYGYRKKELESSLVTNSSTQLSLISGQIGEYGFPKQELEITVPMYTPFVKDIFLLDKINLDIPIDYVLPESGALPARYGTAIYGQSRYVGANTAFSVSEAVNWFVLNRSISIRNSTLKFRLRRE